MLKLSDKLGQKLYDLKTKEYLFTLVKVDGEWLDNYSVDSLPDELKVDLERWGEDDTYAINEITGKWATEDDFYSNHLITETAINKEKEIKKALEELLKDCKTPFLFNGKEVVAGEQAVHYAQQEYAENCGWIYSSICEEVEFDN